MVFLFKKRRCLLCPVPSCIASTSSSTALAKKDICCIFIFLIVVLSPHHRGFPSRIRWTLFRCWRSRSRHLEQHHPVFQTLLEGGGVVACVYFVCAPRPQTESLAFFCNNNSSILLHSFIVDEAGYVDSALGGQSTRSDCPCSTTPTALEGVGSVTTHYFTVQQRPSTCRKSREKV